MKKKIKVGLILIIIIIIIILLIVFNEKDNKKLEKIELNFSSGTEKLNKLEELEIKKYGWLQVQGTNVDIPIIQGSISDYSYGWISTTSIGMKTREVLVGHNVLNVSSTPMVNEEILTDFEDLMAFSYYNFAKDNMYISFSKNGEDKIYVIYAIGFYDYGYDSSEGLNDEKEIDEYIKDAKKNSIYNYDVDVNKDDDIITIKTCTRYFGADEKQQFQIDARELRKDEETLKYNVKKTKLYKEYNLKDNYEKNDNNL